MSDQQDTPVITKAMQGTDAEAIPGKAPVHVQHLENGTIITLSDGIGGRPSVPLEAPYDVATIVEIGQREAGEPHPENNPIARYAFGLDPLPPTITELDQLRIDLNKAKEQVSAGFAAIGQIEKRVRELEAAARGKRLRG